MALALGMVLRATLTVATLSSTNLPKRLSTELSEVWLSGILLFLSFDSFKLLRPYFLRANLFMVVSSYISVKVKAVLIILAVRFLSVTILSTFLIIG